MIVLSQNANAQARFKFLAADKFFDSNGDFIDEFAPVDLPLSKFDSDLGRFSETDDTVVEARISPCEQFSYFA